MCSAVVFDCSIRHAGDEAEPDECPDLASLTAPGMRWSRSLSPAGDSDWFELGVEPRHVYRLNVENGEQQPLLLEVFEPQTLRVIASDRSGASSPELFFSTTGTRALARVRALAQNVVVSSYQLRFVDQGIDDLPNDAALAATIEPVGSLSGSLEYQGDVDAVWLSFPAQKAIRVRPGASSSRFPAFVLSRGGTSMELMSTQEVSLTFPVDTLVLLQVRERGGLGPFSVTFTDEGPDDFCSEPLFAEPLALNTDIQGNLDSSSDVDTFIVPQDPKHVYSTNPSATWSVVDADGRVVANSQSPAWNSRPSNVFLRVGPSSSPASYHVQVRDLGVDDHSDTLLDATPLQPGVLTGGELQAAADIDTFEVSVVQGHAYAVTAIPQSNSLATFISVIDSFGLPSAFVDLNGGVIFNAPRTGKQWVRVSSRFGATGPYSVLLTDLGVDDFGDDALHATPLNGVVQGRVVGTDVDAFSFDVLAGHIYRFVISTQRPFTPSLTLIDPAANRQPLSPRNGVATVELPLAGRWTVLVGNTTDSNDYVLSLEELGVDDHGDTPAAATSFTLSQPVSGRVDFDSDLDVFSIPLTAGHGYAVVVDQPLQVQVTAAGIMIPTAFGLVANQQVFITISGVTGTAYRLSVTDFGVDDHDDTPPLATAVGAGPATGTIQSPDDVDMFAFDVSPNHFYRVVSSLGAQAESVNIAAVPLGQQFRSNSVQQLIRVRGNAGTSYVVSLLDRGLDDHGETPNTATVVPIDGGWLSGTITTSIDTDAFVLPLATSEIAQVEIVQLSGNGMMVTASSAAGSYGNNGTVFRWGFRAGADAPTLLLGSFDGATYELRAWPAVDDFPEMTVRALNSGELVSASIDYQGDHDRFSFTATTGQQVSVSVSSSTSFRHAVIAPNGAVVAQWYTSSFTAPQTGTYFLEVPGEDPVVRPYTVQVTVQ